MHNLRVPILILFICLFYGNINAQLVNIESKRMQLDSIRFALKSDLLFKYSDNNGDFLFELGSNVTTQFKSKDHKKIFFLLGNYNLVRSNDQDLRNSWFIHLRYNQKLTELLRLEAFLQQQNNELLTITNRSLVGTGIRLKVLSNEATKMYFGNAHMYEIEKINTTGQQFYNHRNSSYLSVSHAWKQANLDLTGTVYFQPLYRAIGNHRILQQYKAELPINKVVSLSALFNYFYSSFSPNADKDRSSNLSVGLTINI